MVDSQSRKSTKHNYFASDFVFVFLLVKNLAKDTSFTVKRYYTFGFTVSALACC